MKQRAREVLTPLVVTYAGLGGIAFHLGHGPEHFFCVGAAFVVAVVGTFWVYYNKFFRMPGGSHITECCEKEAGHDT